MKRVGLLLLLVMCCGNAIAQKENNVWVGGNESLIDFNSGSPVVFNRPDNNRIWRTNASVCDASGNLLFYTNGYRVFNRDFQVMQNGNGLDIGDYFSFGYNLLAISDGAVIVPVPGQTGKYYIFHIDINYLDFEQFTNLLLPTRLFYSVVDMSLAGGLGGIVPGQKNIVILSDTLTSCGIKAVKHGNGRDYWLIAHEAGSNRYYRFLIDPYGIHGPFEQFIGTAMHGYDVMLFSTLHFNEQGNCAAQLLNKTTSVDLYDFNRCSGEFYNHRFFKVSDTLYNTLGAAFSPNGRYLYATGNFYLLWQFDLWQPDIFASRQLVAYYDGTTFDLFATDFYRLCLAPDGKIYVHSDDDNRSLHIIHQPDSAGIACQFEIMGLSVKPPGHNWQGFPNIVHHWHPAISGCDSLTSTPALPEAVFSWSAYPNPFADQFNISISGASSNALVEVYDVLGRRVFASTLEPVGHSIRETIDLSGVGSGVYVVKLNVNGRLYSKVLVKKSE